MPSETICNGEIEQFLFALKKMQDEELVYWANCLKKTMPRSHAMVLEEMGRRTAKEYGERGYAKKY